MKKSALKTVLASVLAVSLLFTMITVSFAASYDIWEIKPMQGSEYRLKLRRTPDGEVMGQYYSGTTVEIISFNGKWDKVMVGGIEGYMMHEYLQESNIEDMANAHQGAPNGVITGLEDYRNGVLEVMYGSAVVAKLQEGDNVKVLGTYSDTLLHVALQKDNGFAYGVVDINYVKYADDAGCAYTKLKIPGDNVNIREQPSKDSGKAARLFTGVKVNIMFDNNTADDGWHKISVGDVRGYVMDEFLEFTTVLPRYIPENVKIKNESGSYTRSYNQSVKYNVDSTTPLWLLGRERDGNTGNYLCLSYIPSPEDSYDGAVPVYKGRFITCNIPYDNLVTNTGFTCNMAHLANDTVIYSIDENGRAAVADNTVYQSGIPVQILGSIPHAFNYVAKNASYLLVNIYVGGDMNNTVTGYVKKSDVEGIAEEMLAPW